MNNNLVGHIAAFKASFANLSVQPSAPRTGQAAMEKKARFTSAGKIFQVCFAYNKRTGCKNAAKGCGCDPGFGDGFAHVCNHWDITTNKFCLVTHCREANH